MAVSAGEAIREYRVFLAQDALDALDAWTTAYERAEYLESVRRTTPDRTLVKFDAVPPNFDELITRSMLRGVAVEAGVTVAGLVTLVPKNSVSLYLFPHRFKGYYDFGQALSRLRSGSQAASSATRRLGTKLAAKIVSEVAKTSARAVAKAVLSTGPQIVIGLAIEVMTSMVERIADLDNAHPQLVANRAGAGQPVDIPRMLASGEGARELLSMWSTITSGTTPTGNKAHFAQFGKLAMDKSASFK